MTDITDDVGMRPDFVVRSALSEGERQWRLMICLRDSALFDVSQPGIAVARQP